MSKTLKTSEYRISENFRKRILELMDDCGYESNTDFAKFLGVSAPVISKAINFGILPSTRILIRIADKLEISIPYLIGIDQTNHFIPAEEKTSIFERLPQLAQKSKVKYGHITTRTTFPRTYIYEWLNDKTYPSLDYLIELSDYFNVSVDYLLGRTDYKN